MAKPTRFSFTLHELAELLVREQGLTEGHWEIGCQFNFAAINLNIPPAGAAPTGAMQITAMNLVQVAEPTELSVDAAEIGFPSEILGGGHVN